MKLTLEAEKIVQTSEMSKEEWLEYRRKGIGGSDASAILGMNPYMSAYQVYCDKMGLLPEQEDNEAMRQGRDFEEYVAKRFCEMENKTVRRCNYILRNKKYPFMQANIDRLVVGEDAGLECKTTSALTKTKFDKGDIPIQYYIQCQHYMAVTGAKKWYLGILVLGKDFFSFEIPRHEEDIKKLIEDEYKFWEEHIKAQNPPDPDGSERASEVLKRMYPHATEGTILLGDCENDIDAYLQCKEQMKQFKKNADQIEQRIKAKMGSASCAIGRDYNCYWKEFQRENFDKDALRDAHPDIYQQFIKSNSYRRFDVRRNG